MNGHVQQDLASAFRKHLPDLQAPRFRVASQQSPYEYAEAFRKNHLPPGLYNLTRAWEELLEEPYKGVTSDGRIREGLFAEEDMGIDTAGIVKATHQLLAKLDHDQTKQLRYPLGAKEWRCWSNPEFLLRPLGLRLEELPDELAQSVLGLVQATFSPEGYQKALAAMRLNHFLGELCALPRIMNRYSYNFLLFGEPSTHRAWGWSLYGHHLCLNVFLKGRHITISPCFTGAEPNVIDAGRWKGTAILQKEGRLGLRLMQSLPPEGREKAQIYRRLRDPAMKQTGELKTDRWNHDDQRHLCGAFRDNRVVPYEGVPVSPMTPEQQQLVLDMADEFSLYLPAEARARRTGQVRAHLDETYFSWIGGYGDDDAFYYRIHSPVAIFEFDHHSGVFLSNTEPAPFHTHTICRTPNAGDYGQALRDAPDRVP